MRPLVEYFLFRRLIPFYCSLLFNDQLNTFQHLLLIVYFWEMHVDNVLKPSPRNVRSDPAALRKWERDNKMEKYFFYRWFYESKYFEATNKCRSRSMEVASFHSSFDFAATGNLIANSKYWKSVEYIR